MEEARGDAAFEEQLAHILQRVDRLGDGLGREPVHQIGVDLHAGVAERPRHARHLRHGHAFFHAREQAVGGDLEPPGDGDAAALCEQPTEFRGEGLLEADVAPPGDRDAAPQQFLREGFERFRRRRLVHEMEAALAGLGDDALDAIDEHRGRSGLVARDVIEADIAEAALLPVTAVRDGELVPTPVRPEAVHGIEHVEQRQVAIVGQPLPGGRTGLGERDVGVVARDEADPTRALERKSAHEALPRPRAGEMLEQGEQRSLTAIERHEIEELEHAWLGELAQLGVDIAAAEHGDDAGAQRLDRLCDTERAVHRARERHRDEQDLRVVLLEGCEGEGLQGRIDEVRRRRQGLGQQIELRLARRQALAIPHELEARVDRIADHIGQIIEIERGEVPRAIVGAERPERPAERVAVLARQIGLERREPWPLGEPPPPRDAVRERRVTPLQEGDDRIDGALVGLELREPAAHADAATA